MSTAIAETVLTAPTGQAPARVIIATINRLHGSTGVHTHSGSLHAGLCAAGVRCDIVAAFDAGPHWLGVFAVRRALDWVYPRGSLGWYRHWHAAALRANLRRTLLSENAPAAGEVSVVAQCPVSACVALDVRRSLGLSFPITMVCHFNYSEAREYRDLGQLNDQRAYEAMLAFEANVLTSIDRVVYVSQWARDVVERERGITPRESVVIHNGIAPVVDAPTLGRADIGASHDDFVLMNVGTLEARKNQVALLDLFAAVLRDRSAVRLVLVGDGPDRDKIEQKAESLGISDRVTLLGHRSDVPSLLPLANLYVHYAKAENCPMVLLEAARTNLPWAAVAAAGVVELQHELGGIGLDPDDLPASAKRIIQIMDEPAMAKQLAITGRENFDARFTQSAMTRAYLAALEVRA